MATSFTTPKTWATGDVLTASDVNVYVRDNTSWLGTDKPICRVFNSAAISIASASDTPLTFDSERYDNQNMHSTVTSTSRLTVPTGMGGKYLITGHFEWASHSDATMRMAGVIMNGATLLARQLLYDITGSADALPMSIATTAALSAADYVELRARQASGVAVNVNSSGNYSPEFSAVWLST